MSAPTDYPAVSPYLSSDDAAKAIEFYKAVFGAVERYRLTSPDGRVGHAEVEIQGQIVMLSDEFPGMSTSPKTLGGVASQMVLMVPNTDTVYEKALAAGAKSVMPPENAFYGYRIAVIADPGGQQWMIQHEIEKVSPEEMQKRWDAMAGSCSGSAVS